MNKMGGALVLMFGLFVVVLMFGVMVLIAKANRAKPTEVKNDMTNLVACLAFYHAIYGSFPTGNNAQIIDTLRGGNPRGLMIDSIGPRRMAASKEVLDIWGMAYRFSFESNSTITVSSAGKNGLFGDSDDLVVCVSLTDTNFPFMKIPAQLTNTPPQK